MNIKSSGLYLTAGAVTEYHNFVALIVACDVSCSTNAVFPEGLQDCREDANMIAYADKLRSGYAQTKWVAEQLVMRAQDRGLPAAVYRYLSFLLCDLTKLYRLAALRHKN